MHIWSKTLWIGLVISACNGSVGSDDSSLEADAGARGDCRGNAVRCTVPKLQNVAPRLVEISTRGLERIAPVWTRDPEVDERASFAALVSDSQDRAWFFRSTADYQGGWVGHSPLELQRGT